MLSWIFWYSFHLRVASHDHICVAKLHGVFYHRSWSCFAWRVGKSATQTLPLPAAWFLRWICPLIACKLLHREISSIEFRPVAGKIVLHQFRLSTHEVLNFKWISNELTLLTVTVTLRIVMRTCARFASWKVVPPHLDMLFGFDWVCTITWKRLLKTAGRQTFPVSWRLLQIKKY